MEKYWIFSHRRLTRIAAPFLRIGVGVACVLGAGLVVAQTAASPVKQPLALEFGYPEQPPRIFTDANGNPGGQAVQFVTTLFAKAGIPWHAVSYPASRLYNNLDNGTTTFAIMVRNPVLDKCCLTNKHPIYSTELRIYYIGNKAPIKSRDDLAGKHIILIRGYSYSGLNQFIRDPKNNITIETASTHDAAFDMLAAGRADYVLNYNSSASVALSKRQIADLRHDTVDRIETYIVLSKKYPDAEKVMERFETVLKGMNTEEMFRLPNN